LSLSRLLVSVLLFPLPNPPRLPREHSRLPSLDSRFS
jgi:hypothetical protein